MALASIRAFARSRRMLAGRPARVGALTVFGHRDVGPPLMRDNDNENHQPYLIERNGNFTSVNRGGLPIAIEEVEADARCELKQSMKSTSVQRFNPKLFLAKVGKGRTLAQYKKR